MTREEFVSKCVELFELNNMECSADQAEALYLLTARMLEVNKSMNLTAIKEENAIILRHYVDSITVSEYIPEGSKVIDVGCGAGFPTLPLAIFRPDISVTALDGTAKRISYVAETAKMLGLGNVNAVSGRAEELAGTKEYREKFDLATARAVASLPVLSELCIPFVRVGGKMIAMKAQHAEDEINSSRRAVELCGGALSCVRSRQLLSSDDEIQERTLIVIDKIKKTPPEYPRHFSKISKKPL